MRKISLLLWVALASWETQPLFCQVGSAALASSVPFESWNFAGRTMGGVSVGLADEVPNLLANPANLATLEQARIFLSVNNLWKDFYIQTDFNATSTEASWRQGLNLGYSAASLPVHLLSRNWVVAFSYNGRQWGEFDERYVVDAGKLLGFGTRSGHVRSLSAGLGMQVLSNIRAGVSWTAWSGENEWNHSESFVQGTDDYEAQGWRSGVTAELGRFSLGSALAFPHRVMKSKTTYDLVNPDGAEVTQQFNGALEVGLGYRPWPQWTFGMGYSYQRGHDFEIHDGQLHRTVEYPALSKASAGVEYKFSFAEIRVPIYAAYQVYWRHEAIESSPFYVRSPIFEEQKFRDQLLIGATVQTGSLAIYLDNRLTWEKFQMVGLLPPWS